MAAAQIEQLQLKTANEISDNAGDTNSILQKLKNDLRLVIDKLNEVCLVNTIL